MDPETKRILQESLELSRENNRMLRAMRRASFWSGIFRVLWIAFLIGAPLWLYYHVLGPYIDSLQNAYSGAKGSAEQLQSLGQNIPEPLRSLLNLSGK